MKIKIYSNPKKDWAKALASELAEFLTEAKHTIVRRGAQATICIGGDGTILYANHKKRVEGTVLGIGSEKSYICQLTKDNYKEKILALLESENKQKIMALECEINGKRYIALNDAVIHATHYRVAEMEVSVQGSENKASFEGDGMIISTALGSAAYAFSAGGAKMAPTERKLSLVPISPYKRAFSPQVLSEDATVSISVGSDCAFIIDGIFVRRLKKGEVVHAKKGRDVMFFPGTGKSF